MVDQLVLRTTDGSTRTVDLTGDRYTVGRATGNDLCYPEDEELSRQHLAFERSATGWIVADLGSRNGTRVNGIRINRSNALKTGDRVSAGRLTIEYSRAAAAADPMASFDDRVVFTDAPIQDLLTSTLSMGLDSLPGGKSSVGAQNAAARASDSQMQALFLAGRELADHRPLAELFPLILDLAANAVGSSRGVLMLQESGSLVARAALGSHFEISSTVRDRVLKQKESLLIVDTQLDDKLRTRESIVDQGIRSILAVPLQAKENVIGLIYLDSTDSIQPFTRDDLGLLTVLANIAAIRIENARLTEVEHHERLMAREMEQAAEIQKNLLPRFIPQQPGLELAAFSEPCLSVGGDYYDFGERGGKLMLLVGDVAGKGLPAALLMASLQARIQVLVEEEIDLAALVTRLNRIVASNCPGNRFITLFMCEVDLASGELAYVNAGHNPPLLVRVNGAVERLEGGGMVLGIFGRASYALQTAHMEEGDLLVIFSDGVTEAQDPATEEDFGDVRLLAALAPVGERSPAEMIEQTKNAVACFAGSVAAGDDFTLVVAKRTSGGKQ
jgi:serine phosphatase RsbU (regulator of sigma subunit)